MKSFKMKSICALLCAIVCSSSLFADLGSEQLVAQSSKNKKSSSNRAKNNGMRDPNVWLPFFMKTKFAEPCKTSFYQQNVGIGFLYFGTIRGNLQPANDATSIKSNRKVLGHLMYNRTPVSEFILGTDIWYWLKVAMAYQHQGGVVVQTRPQLLGFTDSPAVAQDFTSHVRLDTVQLKVYFMCPWTLVWKNVYHEPYLAVSVGPGWQTWIDNDCSAFGVKLRPKFSANCVYTIDLGIKMRKAMPSYVMSFTAGCKYTGWGQARSIGKQSQQYAVTVNDATTNNGQRIGFSNPLRIRNVFQFAPYIGVQFNF